MSREVRQIVTLGYLERFAAHRILREIGIDPSPVPTIHYNEESRFWGSIPKYNRAVQYIGGVILAFADLENEPCPSGLIEKHLPGARSEGFILRIAEPMLESWLLADSKGFAKFISVSKDVVEKQRREPIHPKRIVVNLAQRSRSRRIREELVPETGSKGLVGKGYTAAIEEYINEVWNPTQAAKSDESLERALSAIKKGLQL